MMAKNLAIIGAQWGDEGKGAIVAHYLKETGAEICVRAQGGNNAGHTLYDDDGRKVVVNIAPSGIIFPDVVNVIGNGCVVDLEVLASNIGSLKPKLYLSDSAHLLLPYHQQIDALREERRGKRKIGTTQRGIGPAYADKINREGLRLGLLRNPALLEEKIRQCVEQKNEEWNGELARIYGSPAASAEEMIERLRPLFQRFAPTVIDTSSYLHKAIQQGKRIIFEGAQGSLLDLDQGTYPYVTSSNTTIPGILTGTGLGLRSIDYALGVTKAYSTRVGEGIFPTEGEAYEEVKKQTRENINFTDEEKSRLSRGDVSDPHYDLLVSRHIRKVAGEFGATTGRPRRVGWLDLVALKKAIRINGLDYLVLTHLDSLDGLGTVKVCTAYRKTSTGEIMTEFPNEQSDLAGFEPVYEFFPGWKKTNEIRSFDKLPPEAQGYLEFLGRKGLPLSLVKNGPGQEDYIEILKL